MEIGLVNDIDMSLSKQRKTTFQKGTEPYTVIWDFDDDSVVEESEEQTILHSFDEAGTYNVTVDAVDSEEQIASDSVEITVEEEGAENEEETNDLPTVEIVSNGVEGEAQPRLYLKLTLQEVQNPILLAGTLAMGAKEVMSKVSSTHLMNLAHTMQLLLSQIAMMKLHLTAQKSQQSKSIKRRRNLNNHLEQILDSLFNDGHNFDALLQ